MLTSHQQRIKYLALLFLTCNLFLMSVALHIAALMGRPVVNSLPLILAILGLYPVLLLAGVRPGGRTVTDSGGPAYWLEALLICGTLYTLAISMLAGTGYVGTRAPQPVGPGHGHQAAIEACTSTAIACVAFAGGTMRIWFARRSSAAAEPLPRAVLARGERGATTGAQGSAPGR